MQLVPLRVGIDQQVESTACVCVCDMYVNIHMHGRMCLYVYVYVCAHVTLHAVYFTDQAALPFPAKDRRPWPTAKTLAPLDDQPPRLWPRQDEKGAEIFKSERSKHNHKGIHGD